MRTYAEWKEQKTAPKWQVAESNYSSGGIFTLAVGNTAATLSH